MLRTPVEPEPDVRWDDPGDSGHPVRLMPYLWLKYFDVEKNVERSRYYHQCMVAELVF